jgi:hypothetical protein
MEQKEHQMANENPKLTITLTGRPPVKITKDEWPVVASAEENWHDGREHESQSNRRRKYRLIVRQHKDGRTIVYATYSFSSNWQGESGRDVRGGELLTVTGADADHVGDTDAIIAAIQRVGAEIESRMDNDPGVFPRLVHECIADLPAVEI